VKAILYICHGSRVKKAQAEAIAFIQNCMKDQPDIIQEYAFLELSTPTIDEAFSRCIKRGATKIIAVPVLLLTAAHAKEDIPDELSRLSAQYPNVEVKYANPIGVHPFMIDLLIHRLNETKQPVSDQSIVLLIGRGSSDPDVKRDLNIIAGMLKEKVGLKKVQTCFLAVSSPSLEEGLQQVKNYKYDKLFVIPYLFFTGILMNKITELLEKDSSIEIGKMVFCNYIGYDPLVSSILQERVKEAQPLVYTGINSWK
jgi:sirohydrochlorin ferrochelatase